MKYFSTGGTSAPVSFREALFAGLAPDGGLYIPDSIPRLSADFIAGLSRQSLHTIGKEVLAIFIDDLDREALASILHEAWTFPVPLRPLERDIDLLELFHGPTFAFKDLGAQFLARTLSRYLRREQRKATVIVATSGDTGSAVALGFHNVPNVVVCVLYPSGRISRLQEQQMTTLGGNVHAIEVDGSFDDCQRLVKQALADEEVVSSCHLTTANSINIGRLIPQVVYYIWAIAQRDAGGHESGKQPPTFVVPSGNFGNLTAGLYARALGVPVGRLVGATNANDVVPEYLRTGKFRPRHSVTTYSNAMDVGNPSNVARIISFFDSKWEVMKSRVEAEAVSDAETLEEIRLTHRRTGVVLDPHTAVGVAAARRLKPSEHVVVVATAHPAKFPDVIRKALGVDIALPPQLEEALRRKKRSVKMDADYSALRQILKEGQF